MEHNLEHLACEKAKQLYGDPIPEEVIDRLQFELEIIEESGNSNYLLFLQELFNTFREELGVLIGPGRGSIGGSLVAYCLGITRVDPLKHNLLFERCLNPDRFSHIEVWIDVDGVGMCAILNWLKENNIKTSSGDVIVFEDDTNKFTTKLVCNNALSKIKTVLSNIKQIRAIDIDLDKIPADDPKTFEVFQRGDTEGVVCFDIGSMQQWLRYLHPTNFNDLVILNVMFRPGIADYIPQMCHRKIGKEKIEYPIPTMERYLQETYGIVIYQEQIIMLSRLIADFTRGESDTLYQALCKKEEDMISVLKPKFIEGGLRNGHKKATLEKIWKEWEQIGKYAINKAHVVCLTWLSYRMAHLKAHYPEEFTAVMIEYGKE